jgi:uncharacterized protein
LRPFKNTEVDQLKKFNIDILRLSNKKHQYEIDFDKDFFGEFENSLITKGEGKVNLILDKSESMISATFAITGFIELTCDRSLDLFDSPLNVNEKVIFKYGEEEGELTDEIQIISRDAHRINVAQTIYELITMAIPMKKLHPRYEGEDMDDEFIFQTEVEEEAPLEEVDPRWAALKKLKNEGKL